MSRLATNTNASIKSRYRYFKEMANYDLDLKKTLKKPCDDCAITYGFYTPIADQLLEENEELQDEVLNNWYCHKHTNECCKGALNYVKSMRIKRSRGE